LPDATSPAPAARQGGTNTTEIIILRAALADAMKQTLQGVTNATEIISLREGDVLKFPSRPMRTEHERSRSGGTG